LLCSFNYSYSSSVNSTNGYTRSSVYNLIKKTEKSTDKLIVKPNSFVTKILFKNLQNKPKAYGVLVQEGQAIYGAATGTTTTGKIKRYIATKEVIVAGGAFNTPQMLMLSGIGPKDELKSLGIHVVVNLPGVGKNLKDKIETTINMKMTEQWKFNEQILSEGCTFLQGSDPSSDPCLIDFLQKKFPSVYSTPGIVLGLQVKSSDAVPYPDLYGQVVTFPFVEYRDGWVQELYDIAGGPVMTFNINNSFNKTSGEVTLQSADPLKPPIIDFKGYADEDIAKNIAFVTELVGVATFLRDVVGVVDEIIAPSAADLASPEALKAWVLSRSWGHHACCTAKIGSKKDPMAVLDGQFRVRGTRNLRVVDISAFPEQPAFFPMMAIYMLAEKAANDIVAKWRRNDY
jgi:choline dehydrogenase